MSTIQVKALRLGSYCFPKKCKNQKMITHHLKAQSKSNFIDHISLIHLYQFEMLENKPFKNIK